MDAMSWIPIYTLLAINWLSVRRKRIQALLDVYSPPAPSRVQEFDWAGVFTPTPTTPSPPPNTPPTNILVMFLITIVTLFLLSFLWFLTRTTKTDTNSSSSSPFSVPSIKCRWATFTTVIVCVLAAAISSVLLLVAKIATIEGELTAQAVAFDARLAEQSADAANAQSGLNAKIRQLATDAQRANDDRRIAEAKVDALKAQLAMFRALSVAAGEEASDEKFGLLVGVHQLAAQLNSACSALATTKAIVSDEADKYRRLQLLHEALQASYAQVSRDHQILRQRMDFMGRQAGFQQPQQQFGRGFQPQQPQQQHRTPSSPYAQNPGAAFGNLPRRQ